MGTDLTSEVIVSGEVDAQVMGNYELSLYVEDESGRSSQETLIVQVADKASPEISFSDEEPINYLLGLPFVMPRKFLLSLGRSGWKSEHPLYRLVA